MWDPSADGCAEMFRKSDRQNLRRLCLFDVSCVDLSNDPLLILYMSTGISEAFHSHAYARAPAHQVQSLRDRITK